MRSQISPPSKSAWLMETFGGIAEPDFGIHATGSWLALTDPLRQPQQQRVHVARALAAVELGVLAQQRATRELAPDPAQRLRRES